MTREQWLQRASKLAARQLFSRQGYEVPANVRVSCGLPHTGAFGLRKRTIGQCWSAESTRDKTFEIYISPTIDKQVDVLATLVHELVHATVGIPAGHGKIFRDCATKVGLEGKMTSTVPGKQLVKWCKGNV